MFMEAVEKAGINGLITACASGLYYGMDSRIAGMFGQRSMPLYVLAGLIGGAGSVVGDVVHLLMKETIPISKKFNDQASVITSAGVNGALFAACLYMYQPSILRDFGEVNALLLGAGAEVGGSALYTYLKENGYF